MYWLGTRLEVNSAEGISWTLLVSGIVAFYYATHDTGLLGIRAWRGPVGDVCCLGIIGFAGLGEDETIGELAHHTICADIYCQAGC